MRFVFLFSCLAGAACAQVAGGGIRIQAGAPRVLPPGSAASPVAADRVLAHVDGQRISAGQLRELLTGAPPTALQSVSQSPKEFLSWSFLMDKLRVEAEKTGLDKKTPYRHRLAWNYGQVMAMARMETKAKELAPDEAGLKKWYEENRHLYGTAKVKLIYVAAEEGKEEAAKAKMDRLVKQLGSGANFGQLARQHSDDSDSAAKDGDFPDVGPDSKLPVAIRQAIFLTKEDGVTSVIQQPGGFYLFKVVSIEMQPFAQGKDAIREQLQKKRMDDWVAEQRAQARVQSLHDDFFKSLVVREAGMKALGVEEVKPDTPLAKINGTTLNTEEFTNLLKGLPEEARKKVVVRPFEFLDQYALLQVLTKRAEEAGLDKRQPYAGRVRYARKEILTQAVVDKHMNDLSVSAEDQRKGYDDNPGRFRSAKVKVIYISYSLTPPPQTDPQAPKILNEAEAKAKADDVMKQLRGGADFVAMVSRYSEDEKSKAQNGDGPLITPADARIPETIRKPVLAAKEGDLVGPVQLPNGYYILKVVEQKQKSYEEVKDGVYDEIRQQRFQTWFDGMRASIQVIIDDEAAFRQVAAEAR